MEQKYRWEIIGHAKRLGELENDISTGNVSHAYLFAGADHIGKFSIAKKMAMFLQCESGGCGECKICDEIVRGYHSDTIEIPDNGELIPIKEIRDVMDRVNMTKESRYKIVLIQNMERMKNETANTFLKTLEDPPERVVFLLTTSLLNEILPTIISRVRLLKFHPLKADELKEYILKSDPFADEAVVSSVIEFAGGKPGKVIEYMGDAAKLSERKKLFGELSGLFLKADMTESLTYIAKFVKDAKEDEDSSAITDFLDAFMAVLRKEMLGASKTGNERTMERAAKGLKEAQQARGLLKNHINTKLLLENLMITVSD